MDSHRDSQPLRSRRALTEQHHHDSTSSAAPAQQGPTPPTPTPFYIPSSATHNSRPTAIYAKSDSHRLLHSSKSSRDGSPAGKHSRNSFWSNIGGGLDLSNGENRVLIGLTILGAVVRFWHLGRPSSVVFDEVHFGGFANKYIQSRFFMDVHPPLAKLLITLMAWISGFKGGSFDFKDIGREYGPDHVPYLFMRSLPATMGLLLIPLSYLTLRALQTRPTTALLGSLLVMFDNGLTTQSRFILLDSPLIFFTALSVFFWAGFSNENDTPRDRHGRVGPFSRRWWLWLTLTGLALGAVVSCKWVGLFTIATVGVLTIVQLWTLLGDVRVPIPLLAKHFLARAVCLIAVPVVFYMSMFAIHFAILSNSGEGDGFMSSEFQHTLIGHGMEDTFQDVMVGSHITIRHLHTQGGYLHSHPSTYPGGSKQQQVTLYPHRDDNNIWLILNTTKSDDIDPETHSPPTPIMNGAFVVLHHIATNKKLHSHDIRAPVTEVDYQNEVSAYGFDGFDGDANDHFQIEIDDVETDTKGGHKDARKRLQTLRTKFKLRHLLTGCYLFSHKVKLPDWGFEQQEVTCNKNPSKENAIWYVETNTHQALPPTAKKVNYRRPGFFKKFAELQAVMWQTNAGLTDRHAYDSRPESWPVLKRGINFWVKDHRQIYLLGNPFVWFFSTLSVLAYVGVRALLILRAQRGYQDFVHTQVVYYDKLGAFLVLGWFLHYFPFFLMQRQLFLHHYFPALYFAILLSACVFDLTTSMLKPRIRLQVAIVLLLITLYNFWYFSPLTYAGVWTRQQCENAKWLRNWDFSCADFHMTKAEYFPKTSIDPPPKPAETATPTVVDELKPGQNAFAEEEELPAPKSSAVGDDVVPEERVELSTVAADPRQAQAKDVGVLPPQPGATTALKEPEVPFAVEVNADAGGRGEGAQEDDIARDEARLEAEVEAEAEAEEAEEEERRARRGAAAKVVDLGRDDDEADEASGHDHQAPKKDAAPPADEDIDLE